MGLSPTVAGLSVPVLFKSRAITSRLFRFRSPLLSESRLMSFPPATEMFQFARFALHAYVFSMQYPCGVGFPIRTSADQSSFASSRSFSQAITSFIACNRKASTTCT